MKKYSFSELKFISNNYYHFAGGAILKEGLTDIAKGTVGTIADHVMAGPRLLATPLQLGMELAKNTYQNERNRGHGVVKSLVNTTFKPITSVARDAKNTITQAGNEIKNTARQFKSAPIQTTKGLIQGAQDFKEEANQNGVLNTLENKAYGLAQKGAQAATKRAITDNIKKFGNALSDRGITPKVIGEAGRRFADSYNAARTKGKMGIMNSFKAGLKGATRDIDQKTNGAFTDMKNKVTDKLTEIKNSNLGKTVTDIKNNMINSGKEFLKSDTGKKVIGKVTNSDAGKIIGEIAPKTSGGIMKKLNNFMK